MPFVPAKCTNCGANLIIDSAKDAAICKYCNTAFVTEKAINNYSITDSVVHIHNEPDVKPEFEILAGTLISYNGESTSVVIPEEVLKIGRECFKGMPIEEVVFHDKLVSVGDYAFAKCINLKEVRLPDSLIEMGTGVFSCCRSLKYAYYPSSVAKNEGSTFEYCENLEKIDMGQKINYIPSEFARGDEKLKEITIPNGAIFIGTRAFKDCKSLTRVIIPNSVESIDSGAFEGCVLLGDVTFLTATRRIANDAFYNTLWQKNVWKRSNRCPHCGGGILFGRCMNCFAKLES